jgi:hypothetical protein
MHYADNELLGDHYLVIAVCDIGGVCLAVQKVASTVCDGWRVAQHEHH